MSAEPNSDLVWGLIIGTVARMLGQANFLNMFYAFTAQGGNPLIKISPGTYIIFFIWARAFMRPDAKGMETFKLPIYLLLSIVIGGILWALVSGQAVAVGYLIDSYLVAAAGLHVLAKIGPKGREKVFVAIIAALAFNALLLFPEYVLKRRFIPSPWEGARGIFRPAALLNHPLMSGLMYATAVPLVMNWRKPFLMKLAVAFLFVLCVFASGARVASVLTAAVFLPAFFVALVREKPKSSLGQTWLVTQSLMVLGMVPVVVLFAFASGFLDRLSTGLYDKSSATRVWQYSMLQYLDNHQLMFGIGSSTAYDWSTRLFQTPSVESSIILGIFMYGLPFTAFYLSMIFLIVFILAMKGNYLVKAAALVFMVAAMSNNTLSAKNPAIFFLLMFMGASMVDPVRKSLKSDPRPRALQIPPADRGVGPQQYDEIAK